MTTSPAPAAPRVTLTFVARATLVVILLWALASALWLARDILFVTLFAVLVGTFLSIFVDPLVRAGLPRGAAAPLVLVTLLAVVVGLWAIAWPTLQEQAGVIREQVPAAVSEVQQWVHSQTAGVSMLGAEGDEIQAEMQQRLRQQVASLLSGTIPLINNVLGILSGVFLVLFAGFFLAVAPDTYRKGMERLVPASSRGLAEEVLPEIGTTLRQWIKGVAMAMLLIAFLFASGLALLGVPAFLALGLFAGAMAFIPFLGPVLGAIPAVGVALTVSPHLALWVVLLYLGIQLVESNLITPLLMKGMVELEPALTILFQVFMGALFGILGLALAVPLLAMGKVLVRRLYVERVADQH